MASTRKLVRSVRKASRSVEFRSKSERHYSKKTTRGSVNRERLATILKIRRATSPGHDKARVKFFMKGK